MSVLISNVNRTSTKLEMITCFHRFICSIVTYVYRCMKRCKVLLFDARKYDTKSIIQIACIVLGLRFVIYFLFLYLLLIQITAERHLA